MIGGDSQRFEKTASSLSFRIRGGWRRRTLTALWIILLRLLKAFLFLLERLLLPAIIPPRKHAVGGGRDKVD